MSGVQTFTIKDHVSAELVEKKSRFICQIKHVETENEALLFIAEIKKQHSQARHNVYAYIVEENKNSGVRVRFSDDGEPSQTAGKPTLEVLQHANLINVACVVTRYFGGTLLGTGGLVRAYSGSVKRAIDTAKDRGKFERVVKYEFHKEVCSYAEYEKLKHRIAKSNGIIDRIDYSQNVEVEYRLPFS